MVWRIAPLWKWAHTNTHARTHTFMHTFTQTYTQAHNKARVRFITHTTWRSQQSSSMHTQACSRAAHTQAHAHTHAGTHMQASAPTSALKHSSRSANADTTENIRHYCRMGKDLHFYWLNSTDYILLTTFYWLLFWFVLHPLLAVSVNHTVCYDSSQVTNTANQQLYSKPYKCCSVKFIHGKTVCR